ncbi:hypothetical protein WwAna0080 [Wolbachia endosymbiont of Drosophila ananassae]|nr:hypothetical protein WwAna0080 [Wolbachia endosymbiont of Drosophila ananassae]
MRERERVNESKVSPGACAAMAIHVARNSCLD